MYYKGVPTRTIGKLWKSQITLLIYYPNYDKRQENIEQMLRYCKKKTLDPIPITDL